MAKIINVKITHVYDVNGTMVVADTIEHAIATYRVKYTDLEVRNVKQIFIGSASNFESYDALIDGRVEL